MSNLFFEVFIDKVTFVEAARENHLRPYYKYFEFSVKDYFGVKLFTCTWDILRRTPIHIEFILCVHLMPTTSVISYSYITTHYPLILRSMITVKMYHQSLRKQNLNLKLLLLQKLSMFYQNLLPSKSNNQSKLFILNLFISTVQNLNV